MDTEISICEYCIEQVIQHEDASGKGVVINDSGGKTRWGISQRSYPTLNISSLTKQDAINIYKVDFWDVIHASELLNKDVALKMLDISVNMGKIAAIKLFQRVLGINDDGVIGPDTIKHINDSDPQELLKNVRDAQKAHYTYLAQKHPARYKRYLNGWIRRAELC